MGCDSDLEVSVMVGVTTIRKSSLDVTIRDTEQIKLERWRKITLTMVNIVYYMVNSHYRSSLLVTVQSRECINFSSSVFKNGKDLVTRAFKYQFFSHVIYLAFKQTISILAIVVFTFQGLCRLHILKVVISILLGNLVNQNC